MSDIVEENEIVEDLSIMMRGKLRANCHKPSWRSGTTFDYLLERLRQEVAELEEEISKENFRPGKVRMECADAANILAMISDLSLRMNDSAKP